MTVTMKMMDFEERFLIGRMDLRAWNTKLKLTLKNKIVFDIRD